MMRRLPIVGADAIGIASESRPGRLLYAGQRLVWTIPTSGEATLRVGIGRLPSSISSPGIRIRARRSSPGGRAGTLAAVVLGPEQRTWRTWNIPWAPHREPMELEIDVERATGAPGRGGAAAGLVAEPLLIPSAERNPGRNMVVFLVDTLRADRLGCYGDADARTPEFDALAGSGIRVVRALSTADWTLPAHASLFTSTDVSTHGVGSVRPRLPKDLPTLAEILQRQGYRTIAVTNGGFLDPQFGLARGFQRYFTLDLERESIETTVLRAARLIAAERGAPFFLFFHTYQVHDYHRHRREDIRIFAPRLRQQYDAQVSRTDAAFGAFRAELRRLGLGDSTAILLTSDHGEILDDGSPSETAQRFGHTSPYLHDNETRIPMILFDPRRPRAAVVDRPVSIIDVAPTALSVLGIGSHPEFRGLDFSRDGGGRIPPDRLRVTEEPYSQSLALEQGGEKLIVRPARSSLRAMWVDLPYGPLDPLSAFDLRSDPRESADLIPGPRTSEFDALFAEASRSVADRFPGAVVIRVPPSDRPVSIEAEFDAGVRRWQFFSGGEPSRIAVAERERGLTATVPPCPGPGWMIIEPRRRRDGFVCSLTSRSPVVLGSGERAAVGETRRTWTAMLETRLSRDREAILLCVSKLDRLPNDRENAAALPAENVAQLKSLGYLNFRTGESADQAAPLPGVGSGVIRVRWQPEPSR
jgi:arylsulfatase A-like enzyme